MKLVIGVAVLLLTACASPQQRMQQDIAQARTMCLAAGFQAGSNELATCTVTQAQAIRRARAERVRAGGEALMKWSQQMQQQQMGQTQNAPHFTNCYPIGNMVQCVTQ